MITRGFIIWLCMIGSTAEAGCGADPLPCALDGGSYHVAQPDDPNTLAVVFLHGHGGSGAGSLKNRDMVADLLARGYTVIAPDGQARANGKGRSWSFGDVNPEARDDTLFIRTVADHAASRFGLQRGAMVLAGFSVGGSMVSYVACRSPESFAAFAPIAGSFWHPVPETCKGAVALLHTHGWADLTVPLEGRAVGDGLVQGDVFHAMQIWRRTNNCHRTQPDNLDLTDVFHIRRWQACDPGAPLTLALHFGGHVVPKEWPEMAIDWFEQVSSGQ